MRSTYETLIDRFSENTIEDMLIELHANAIHNTPVSKQGPLQLFRDKLKQDGFPEYNVARLAESALRDYVLIKHVEAYKRRRSIPKDMTEITLQIPKEDLAKIKEPRPMSIGYQVSSFKEYPDFNDKENHHQDALKYKKED